MRNICRFSRFSCEYICAPCESAKLKTLSNHRPRRMTSARLCYNTRAQPQYICDGAWCVSRALFAYLPGRWATIHAIIPGLMCGGTQLVFHVRCDMVHGGHQYRVVGETCVVSSFVCLLGRHVSKTAAPPHVAAMRHIAKTQVMVKNRNRAKSVAHIYALSRATIC